MIQRALLTGRRIWTSRGSRIPSGARGRQPVPPSPDRVEMIAVGKIEIREP